MVRCGEDEVKDERDHTCPYTTAEKPSTNDN